MNSEAVILFKVALQRGDDAFALSLLENGRVSINSVFVVEDDGARFSLPLMCLAVAFAREEVARALVWRGASIDSFHDGRDASSITPAGEAILESNVSALSLFHRLGANLSCVSRTAGSPPKLRTGLEIASRAAEHTVLIFLLDVKYTARPVRLGDREAEALVSLASHGSPAKVCFEVLES